MITLGIIAFLHCYSWTDFINASTIPQALTSLNLCVLFASIHKWANFLQTFLWATWERKVEALKSRPHSKLHKLNITIKWTNLQSLPSHIKRLFLPRVKFLATALKSGRKIKQRKANKHLKQPWEEELHSVGKTLIPAWNLHSLIWPQIPPIYEINQATGKEDWIVGTSELWIT